MQAVCGYAAACPSPREFAGVENVTELAAAVNWKSFVVAGRLQVIEIQLLPAMGVRSSVYQPSRRRGAQPVIETVRQHEITHVVERKGQLQAVFGDLPLAEHGAGVVDENINARLGRG